VEELDLGVDSIDGGRLSGFGFTQDNCELYVVTLSGAIYFLSDEGGSSGSSCAASFTCDATPTGIFFFFFFFLIQS